MTGGSGDLDEALIRTLEPLGHTVIGVDIAAEPFTLKLGSITDRAVVRVCTGAAARRSGGVGAIAWAGARISAARSPDAKGYHAESSAKVVPGRLSAVRRFRCISAASRRLGAENAYGLMHLWENLQLIDIPNLYA